MSGIDDLNFEDLVDGAINTIDDAKTERFEAKLIQPKKRGGSSIVTGRLGSAQGGPMTDKTVEMLAETARMTDPPGPPEIPGKASGGNATFEHIYMRSGVEEGEFTIFRLEELFHDEDLKDLDEKGRVAAVRAILKSHDVDIESIIDDAVARRAALDTHDQRLKSNIQRVAREMENENARLQTEIEEYANPRIERMEKNNERVERLRRDYAEWEGRKIGETDRLVNILEPWGGAAYLPTTERIDVAAPAPMAVSGNEAFESEPEVAAPKAVDDSVLMAAGADQWDFPEDPTIEPRDPAPPKAKVSTELPSEFGAKEQAGVTGEFDFLTSKRRVPRTVMQWLFTLLTLALVPVVGILLAAQLSTIEAPFALGLAFLVPFVAACIPTVLSAHRSDFWSGLVVWWMVFLIAGFLFAHVDPPNLITNLTKRPLWFVDEVGLNAEVEEAVHMVGRPYAEAIAPLFGAEDAVWNPPKSAAPPADTAEPK